MDARKYMIIIKNEIKTSEVRFCNYNRNTKKWDVQFKDGKTYSYSYINVEWLKEPQILNPNMFRIHKNGHTFFDVKEVYVFRNENNEYWHVCFGNGSENDYLRSEIQITRSCLNHDHAGNVFNYIKQIADLSEIKNRDTNENLLAKRFSKISFVGEDMALAKYLNPSLAGENGKRRECIPIFPFGCNNSQYNAVKNAMENQISVIQGPPGTGKTQTILNIIANILMQGKTVQIVSNNNSATKNVYEKLASPKYDLGFLVAALGSSDNKAEFISRQNGVYPDFSLWRLKENANVSLRGIQNKSLELKTYYDKQEELANLKQEKIQLETELQYFNQYVRESNASIDEIITRRWLSSKQWMFLWQEYQYILERKRKIGLFARLKKYFEYGIHVGFYKQDMEKMITTFQDKFYRTRSTELSERIVEIEKYLGSVNHSLSEDMCKQSMEILKDKLAERYKEKKQRQIFDEADLWKNSYKVLEEYPIILSTTFSSTSSLNTDVIYDYLIMDEASQVDVATGALALSCARNVVIVGDTKQLPNVVTEEIRKRSQAIFDSFQIHKGYQFTKSFLQSILEVMPDVTQTLLREHYRCHPKIINFCNQKFYRGELIVMTEDKGEKDVLVAIKTVPGNHVRNHYSQRQIDVIRNEIIPKYVTDAKQTGIIAPYKNQVKALEEEFKDIDAATVHKFQGREKDTIIISTVDDEITDFADDPYLINVAVSRAKKKLMLVVTGNEQIKERNITDLIAYIQYNNFEVTESKVYSVFDYLYKQYKEERIAYLKKHKKVSQYDSENLMYAVIEEVLAMDRYACLDVLCHFPMNMLIKNHELLNEQEFQYAVNPATHFDFMLYNRISKKPVLVIEVDGYKFHKEDTKQHERDLLKDRILEKYEISFLRMKTNGSGEKEKILDKLQTIMEQESV